MLKNFFKFEKWFGVIILAAFMNMALFSYDALCAQTLSRDKAATLIQKSLSEVKTKVRLHDSGYQKGLQHGMWSQTYEKSTYVTSHGDQYFQSIKYSADFWGNFAAQASGSGSGSVTLKKPVNVRVKVTGIRGGSTAEFTWEYVGLPSVVKRYVVRGGIGTAQFTLYDDGWRLTNINHRYLNEPATQTAKELAEDKAATLAWQAAERRRQVEKVHASIANEMVLVKGGCFEMGDTFGDGQPSEKPVHDVCVNDFYVGRYEVTQREWFEVMGTNQDYLKCCEHSPVFKASWNDVQEFIGRLNQVTGENYRLPTEAEWEYAARSGGKKEKFAGTSSESEVGEYAWYFLNATDSPHPVGQKRPNELGLYDICGNAWEWVQDWFDLNYYSNSPKDNPKGPLRGQYRVFRGGDTLNLRSLSSRAAAEPSYNCCGFRLAKTK